MAIKIYKLDKLISVSSLEDVEILRMNGWSTIPYDETKSEKIYGEYILKKTIYIDKLDSE